MSGQLESALEGAILAARVNAKHTVGEPIVVCLEAMGYRIVPEWTVEAFAKVLRQADEKKEAGR